MSKVHTYRGFTIERGAYQGTTDDRLDRWYYQAVGAEMTDRLGPGCATLADARRAIDDYVAVWGE